MILGPIIGGLSDTKANLWGRSDRPGILFAWLATKRDLSDTKKKGFAPLGEATGFSGMVTLEHLQPATRYYFALTLDPLSKPSKTSFHSFKTFPPSGDQRSFSFGFGSCFMPNSINSTK